MLHKLLNDAAKNAPSNTALLYRGNATDYQTLSRQVDQLAAGFIQSGTKIGDRVAFFLTDCVEELCCYYACFKIGAIAVPLYSGLRGQDLSHSLHETEPRIIITDNNHYSHIADIVSTLSELPLCYIVGHQRPLPKTFQAYEALLQDSDSIIFPELKPDTIASIFYTSGSTAKPKGVVHTHQQIMANIINVTKMFKVNKHDRFLVPGALDFNANICTIVLPCAYNKATLILLPSFEVDEVFNAITQQKTTIMFMVPSRYAQLIDYAEQNQPFSHQLRFSIVGGDTPPTSLFEDYCECFHAPLSLGMGMTETMCQTHNLSTQIEKQGSVGLPLDDISIKIVDENNQPLPHGETGEVLIQSPTNFLEYWRHPKATAETLKNGWLYSGDLGYLDHDGYLWLQGRKKHIIIRDGDNISPVEVENIIRNYSDIQDAAVFGLPNPKHGASVHAVIVVNNNNRVDLDQLTSYLRSQLADYKVPETIQIVDSLPVNKRGKLDRAELLKRYEYL